MIPAGSPTNRHRAHEPITNDNDLSFSQSLHLPRSERHACAHSKSRTARFSDPSGLRVSEVRYAVQLTPIPISCQRSALTPNGQEKGVNSSPPRAPLNSSTLPLLAASSLRGEHRRIHCRFRHSALPPNALCSIRPTTISTFPLRFLRACAPALAGSAAPQHSTPAHTARATPPQPSSARPTLIRRPRLHRRPVLNPDSLSG